MMVMFARFCCSIEFFYIYLYSFIKYLYFFYGYSKSEFVIYKLKEMGKIAEKDILQICKQFDSLEHNNYGKITLADLMESH